MGSGRMVKAMDALLQAGVRIENVAGWCREHGINPRTFYRHRARIAAEGTWRERSRRPRHSPGGTGPDLDGWICKLRAELGVDNGADFIRDALVDLHATTSPGWAVPSRFPADDLLSRMTSPPCREPRRIPATSALPRFTPPSPAPRDPASGEIPPPRGARRGPP